MSLRLAAGLLGALLLSGCVTGTRAPPAQGAAASRPLVAPSAVGDRTVSQVVRGAVGDRVITMNCVVSVKGNEMSVVGLNAMGVRLFTMRYDGKSVSAEKSLGLPEDFRPEWLIADLQFVFWPLTSLVGPLREAGFEISEPAPGTRRLRGADRLIAEAHYVGNDPWSGRAWLVNLEHGYSLQIDESVE